MKFARFSDTPSIFFLNSSDLAFKIVAWIGLTLAVFAVTGLSESFGIYASVLVWFCLWLIYLSFVNVGGTFYSFGWETLLLEAGFLTIFLGSNDTQPPVLVIWLLRWLLFRLMFGAGLIKIRGDECWRDLTCMLYHYETQPMPNPLSWHFHRLPLIAHKSAVLFNHFVELVVPFFFFVPAAAKFAGMLTIVFQALLIVSGNFSWLNYISLCLCISCFDDSFFRSFLTLSSPEALQQYSLHHLLAGALTLLVAVMSIKPVMNLISPRQIMNTSFEPLHLVNTYGAFGSITRVRREIIIEGTEDSRTNASTNWSEYEFKGKPGNPMRMPPLVAPYHYRLDWQLWFSAMAPRVYEQWFLRFIGNLLRGDKKTLALLAKNPFPYNPPTYVRALLYEYHFTSFSKLRTSGSWWERKLLGTYCPPVRLEDLERAEKYAEEEEDVDAE